MSQTKAQLLGPLVGDDIPVEGELNLDNGTLKVDPTNNRIGINKGANAPEKTLDIGGDVQLTDLYYTADYPTVRPTIDLAFDKVKKLDNRITFRRESIGTFVNSDGYIETAGHNKPRFNHDPTTRESLGLLIEESRINVSRSSEDFSNTTYWSPTSQTVISNATLSPDETVTGDNVVPAVGTNSLRYLYYVANPYTMSVSTVYTSSIFVKKNGLRYFAFQVHDNGFGSGHRAGFDLDNGIVVASTVNNMGSGTGATASIVSYPNGWYRCIITGTTAPTGTLGRTAFSFTSSLDANASLSAITADGISGGYVWGMQVEQGTFPTSYIPTSGSTVTRQADCAAFEGTNLTDWYNQSEGTWIVDTNKTESIDGYYAALFYMRPVSNSTANTRNEMYKLSGSGRIAFNYDENSGDPATVNLSTTDAISSGDNTIFAFYKVNDYGLGFNGIIKTTGDTGDVQVNTDPNIYLALGSTFDPSSGGSSEHWNGHFRRFTYYPYRLNNSQIANLTL